MSRHFTMEEVCEGVYAAIAQPSTGAVANAAIVNLGNSLLIVDTFNTQQAAAELRESAERLTGLPVGYVFNTHWHGDHIRGNQVFKDVPIISSETTCEEMAKLHPARIERQRNQLPQLIEHIQSLQAKFEQTEDVEEKSRLENEIAFLQELKESLPTLELVLPTTTFRKNHRLQGSKRTVELMTYGGGHTVCDAFVYLPDEKIAILGDLIGIDNHVMVADGNPEKWIQILQEVKKLEIETVICGHGPVGTADAIDVNVEYLSALLSISELFASTSFDEEAIKEIEMPARYQNWEAGFLFHRNLQFLNQLKSTVE